MKTRGGAVRLESLDASTSPGKKLRSAEAEAEKRKGWLTAFNCRGTPRAM
jgi:hypothetical protein